MWQVASKTVLGPWHLLEIIKWKFNEKISCIQKMWTPDPEIMTVYRFALSFSIDMVDATIVEYKKCSYKSESEQYGGSPMFSSLVLALESYSLAMPPLTH